MLSVVKTSIILVYNLKLVENILRNGIGKPSLQTVYSFIGLREVAGKKFKKKFSVYLLP